MGKYRLVTVESPYAGEVERNVAYARAALRDCLKRGEAPYASHLLYTQEGVLRDDIPEERKAGIEAGLAWKRVSEATVVYTDLGITDGMRAGEKAAEELGQRVEYRSIGLYWESKGTAGASVRRKRDPWLGASVQRREEGEDGELGVVDSRDVDGWLTVRCQDNGDGWFVSYREEELLRVRRPADGRTFRCMKCGETRAVGIHPCPGSATGRPVCAACSALMIYV